MFQTLFDQKSQDDSLQLVSMIESIDPGDHIMTITLKNGSHFCGTDEEYELRKLKMEGKQIRVGEILKAIILRNRLWKRLNAEVERNGRKQMRRRNQMMLQQKSC